jgi:16S rRNA (guanine1207-N2)-methyltransferase
MAHYYDKTQEGELRYERVTVQARGENLELWSGSGVFSKKKVDRGTQLLLDECTLESGWSVLDLGCGNGIVGIVLKTHDPSLTILCSDVSSRAVKIARKNVRELQLDITLKNSDGFEKIGGEFDTILFNPPYVAGRKVIFSLLEQSLSHLKSGGLLQVVARHNKGGAMIKKKLTELFENCEDNKKSSGYRIYCSRKE